MVNPLDALAPALFVAALVVLIATLRARPWRASGAPQMPRSTTIQPASAPSSEGPHYVLVDDPPAQRENVREQPDEPLKERRAGEGDDP